MHAESKRNPVIVPAFRPETEYRGATIVSIEPTNHS